MENLTIEKSKATPEINFNAETGKLLIQGESYPENTAQFYQPVFQWINDFLQQLGDQSVTLSLELTYFNSSSSKILMDLFDLLEERAEDGIKVVIQWRYHEENEMSLEYGEEFQEDLEAVQFELVSFS